MFSLKPWSVFRLKQYQSIKQNNKKLFLISEYYFEPLQIVVAVVAVHLNFEKYTYAILEGNMRMFDVCGKNRRRSLEACSWTIYNAMGWICWRVWVSTY